MDIPSQAPVMTLPSVTLFPRALLPLHIFEPRYRRMLDEALGSHRMLIVAMRKPGSAREVPCSVAGLGVVRVCVRNNDGTAHLILQGITRVELTRTVRQKPYRVSRIRMLPTPSRDSVAIDALMAKVRDLVTERIEQELPLMEQATKPFSVKEIVASLDQLNDPDRVADLVTWSLLRGAVERQTILETIEVEPRLKHLIHFLMEEIRQQQKYRSK
ncbi:MAG: LON peptidase substrate-binding domain-containing protein [Verrucomicrobiota bacterium]|jgi:ATP-dependent Lon protease